MNTAWNRWCRNLPSGTALSLYDNRIIPIIITDITGRRNVRVQNPYTCTTSSGFTQVEVGHAVYEKVSDVVDRVSKVISSYERKMAAV